MAFVEFGGPPTNAPSACEQMRALTYNDLSADRNCVAIVQAMEAILAKRRGGQPGCVVKVNGTGRRPGALRAGQRERRASFIRAGCEPCLEAAP